MTLASNITYQGKGTITELGEFNTGKGTCTVALSGPEKLSQQ